MAEKTTTNPTDLLTLYRPEAVKDSHEAALEDNHKAVKYSHEAALKDSHNAVKDNQQTIKGRWRGGSLALFLRAES